METLVRILGTHLPGRTCGPHADIEVGLQRGKEIVERFPADTSDVRWETSVSFTRDATGVRLARGPALHGPRAERFFYLVWVGRLSGAEAGMFRRAKLQLDAIPDALFDDLATNGGVLLAELHLTDQKGEPVCASVRPPRIRWSRGALAPPDGVR